MFDNIRWILEKTQTRKKETIFKIKKGMLTYNMRKD